MNDCLLFTCSLHLFTEISKDYVVTLIVIKNFIFVASLIFDILSLISGPE